MKALNVIAQIVGLAAWIWLLMIDWKLALAIFLMLWANNITQKDHV